MNRTFPTRADVVIVGSGPAGATYARVLSEEAPEALVAIFEVGPQLADPPGVHVKNIVDLLARADAQRRSEGPNERPLDQSRVARPGTFLLADGFQFGGEDGLPAAAMSSNVGGMGAHWTAACPRPGGCERPELVTDLDELLTDAERILNVTKHAFDDAPFSDEVRRRLAEVFDAERSDNRRVQPMPLAVQRHNDGTITWSGSDVIFGEATRTNPNCTLTSEALVTRVLVADSRVYGVLVRDMRTGDVHEVSAQRVVVAGDALRTPQLLWASGIRPEALGRYLNDQPQTIYAVRLRDVSPTPNTAIDSNRSSTIVPQSGVSWVPYTDDMPFHGQVMQIDASPIQLTDEDVVLPGTIVGLGWFCTKEIQADDRVDFDDAITDPYGLPAMRIHYRLTETDHASIARAHAILREAGKVLGDPLEPDPKTLPPGASLHYQGTVRMGEHDDGTSVCDTNSMVWGVSGLFVAGNGVIPTPTACNPTLTATALAVRGARHIARTLDKKD